MGQRSKADLELARLISDRVALVLADRPPRRARDPDELLDGPPDNLPAVLPYELPDELLGRAPGRKLRTSCLASCRGSDSAGFTSGWSVRC